MRLGRLPPHQPDVLAAAPSHKFGAAVPPVVLNRSHVSVPLGLYGNDTFPDCTAAGLANAAASIAALNGYQLVIDPAKVPAFFAGCLGIPDTPADLERADGAVVVDVLNYMQTHGFDIGPQLLAGQWGTLGLDRPSLALGIARLGVGYWGVTLRERDEEAFASGAVWDVQDGRDDGAVVGGHLVVAFDYSGLQDGAVVRLATWGAWQPATWAWVAARLDEAHGLVLPPLAPASGQWFVGYQAGTI